MLKPTNILTNTQLLFLDVCNESSLISNFYLSGGTALCGFYIPYRKSEDLDFFSQEEFNSQDIIIWLRSVQSKLKYNTFDIQTSFNRNLIFLEFENETLKTEFTYYPFPTQNSNKYRNVTIDSIKDIALNKLFTIYQNPRLRDFMDLYKIIRKEELNFKKLRIDAKTKFDWDIDPLQLGTQLLKSSERKDVPILVEEFDFDEMEEFYKKTAASFKQEVVE